MNRLQRKALAKYPTPPTTPREALEHFLAVFEDYSDEMIVATATYNVYPEAHWTGLRLGDMRALRADLTTAEGSA